MALLVPRRFELRAYDKDFTHLGVLVGRNSDVVSASFTSAHNGIGTGSLTLPLGHKMIRCLMQPGSRLQYRFIDHTGAAVLQMSGFIRAFSGEMSPRTGTVTFTCVSDESLLRDTLAWPVPTATLSAQTSEYDTRAGAADAVCMDLAVANLVTRLGRPVRQVPFVADGPTVTIKARMQPVLDVIQPVLEAANKGVRCWQWNPGDPVPYFLVGQLTDPCVLMEITSCRDRPYVQWTTKRGITAGTVGSTSPTATRMVMGGGGEGTLRVFAGFVDTARESEWGALGVVERFSDARDTSVSAELQQRANEDLTEAAGTTSLDISTVDGDPWTYGTHYELGDVVRVELAEGVVRAEKVRAVTVSIDGERGIRLSPRVGDPSPVADPQVVQARSLDRALWRTRKLEARR